MEVYSYNPLTGLKKMGNWGTGPQIVGVFLQPSYTWFLGPPNRCFYVFLLLIFLDQQRDTETQCRHPATWESHGISDLPWNFYDENDHFPIPRASMYGILTYFWLIFHGKQKHPTSSASNAWAVRLLHSSLWKASSAKDFFHAANTKSPQARHLTPWF